MAVRAIKLQPHSPHRLTNLVSRAVKPRIKADDPNQHLRELFEKNLAGDLGRALNEQEQRVLGQLGWPPDLARLDGYFWNLEAEAMMVFANHLSQFASTSAFAMLETGNLGGPIMDTAWGLIPERAQSWASTYTYDLVKGINQATMDVLRQEISLWLGSQETWGYLATALQASGIWTQSRAELIAVTEVTRAMAMGTIMGGNICRDAGLEVMDYWNTNRDELVCPACGPVDGKPRGSWPTTTPPAHPGCRCWITTTIEDPMAFTVDATAQPVPTPAPGVITHAGARIQDMFQKVPSTPRWAPVRKALDLMGKLHGFPTMGAQRRPIPIKASKSTSFWGRFTYRWGGPTGKKEAQDIKIVLDRNLNPEPLVTTAHETAHYFDLMVMGRGDYYWSGTSTTGGVSDLMATINKSAAITAIRDNPAQFEQRYTRTDPYTGQEKQYTYPVDMKYVRYLLQSHEEFARAYSQWVALRSGDADMIAEVDARLAEDVRRNIPPQHWTWEDFDPIATEFDKILLASEYQPAPGG